MNQSQKTCPHVDVRLRIKGFHVNKLPIPMVCSVFKVRVLRSSVRFGPVYINRFKTVERVLIPCHHHSLGRWSSEGEGIKFMFYRPFMVTIRGASLPHGDTTTIVKASTQETMEQARLVQTGHTQVLFSLRGVGSRVRYEQVVMEDTSQLLQQTETSEGHPDCFVKYEVVHVPKSPFTLDPVFSRHTEDHEDGYPSSLQRRLNHINARRTDNLFNSFEVYAGHALC